MLNPETVCTVRWRRRYGLYGLCARQRLAGMIAALLLLVPLALADSAKLAREAAAVEARLRADVGYLASDACEGRGLDTKGIHVAAQYIADEFKRAGLRAASGPDYYQHFAITGGARLGTDNAVVLRGPLGQRIELKLGQDYSVVALGGKGRVHAPVVFAGYGISAKDAGYDDYQQVDVSGKVVIVLRQLPRHNNPEANNFDAQLGNRLRSLQEKAVQAALRKAAAIVFVNDYITAAQNRDQLMDFNYTARSGNTVDLPAVHIKRSFVRQMMQSTLGEDLVDIERSMDRTFAPRSTLLAGWSAEIRTDVERQKLTAKNVIGVIEGTGPLADETVVVGAHYDHLGYGGPGSLALGVRAIHYGADDNASGTAVLLELARRCAAWEATPRRRLVFIAFSGEERGLLGSEHYCRHPLFPLDRTVAMVNMDMVGRLREDRLTVYGTGTAKGFAELIDRLNQRYQFKISKVATGFGPSDHSAFYGRNIPVFHFFTGMHNEYHRPQDKPETINFEGMRRITDMIEELLRELATQPHRPEYVKVPGVAQVGGPRGPRLGIRPSYSDEEDGVLIDGVIENTPAHKAGLRQGDRIVEIAGKPVKNLTAYMSLVANYRRGDKIPLTVLRQGQRVQIVVALE